MLILGQIMVQECPAGVRNRGKLTLETREGNFGLYPRYKLTLNMSLVSSNISQTVGTIESTFVKTVGIRIAHIRNKDDEIHN